jgi:hypothetical protein
MKRQQRPLLHLFLCLGLMIGFNSLIHAQVSQSTWVGSGSGNWENSSNGRPSVPGGTDVAMFGGAGSGTVTLNGSAFINGCEFSNSRSSYFINGSGTINLIDGGVSNAPFLKVDVGSPTINNSIVSGGDLTPESGTY